MDTVELLELFYLKNFLIPLAQEHLDKYSDKL